MTEENRGVLPLKCWDKGLCSCASVREASCCIHMLLGVGFHIKLSGFRPFAIRDFIVMQMCKPKQRETTGPDPGDCPRTGQSLAFTRNLQNSLVPTFSPFFLRMWSTLRKEYLGSNWT